MNIGHGQGVAYDSRQRGNIGHLLQRLLLGNLAQHAFVGEDKPWHAHAGLVGRRNLPTIVVDFFQDVSPGSSHGPYGIRDWGLGIGYAPSLINCNADDKTKEASQNLRGL